MTDMTPEEVSIILLSKKASLLEERKEVMNWVPGSVYLEAYVDKKGHVADTVSAIILQVEEIDLCIEAIDLALKELSVYE